MRPEIPADGKPTDHPVHGIAARVYGTDIKVSAPDHS
jgi:hypothetical protein